MGASKIESNGADYTIETNKYLVKLKRNLSESPLSHDDLDNNWEIIRRTLNEVIDSVDEVTTDSTFGSNLFVNKIADNVVTSAKIADGAVGSTKIADGAIDTIHFKQGLTLPDTVTVDRLNNDSISILPTGEIYQTAGKNNLFGVTYTEDGEANVSSSMRMYGDIGGNQINFQSMAGDWSGTVYVVGTLKAGYIKDSNDINVSWEGHTHSYNELTDLPTPYALPVAGASLGGVKEGGDIDIDASGNMTIKDGTLTFDKISDAPDSGEGGGWESLSGTSGWIFLPSQVDLISGFNSGTDIKDIKVFGDNGVPINARRAMMTWGTYQGYIQIRNRHGCGWQTVTNIGDNADGSNVFFVENIQHLKTFEYKQYESGLTANSYMDNNDKVPDSKTHANLLEEGVIQFVFGDGNHDGASGHTHLRVVAYSF